MLEYQFLPENIPAILRGFAVLIVLACCVAFFFTFISGATKPGKTNQK